MVDGVFGFFVSQMRAEELEGIQIRFEAQFLG
jgi:hypothetical protein